MRPDRISLPMIRTQAVTVSGAVSFILSSWSLAGRRWLLFIGEAATRHNRRRRGLSRRGGIPTFRSAAARRLLPATKDRTITRDGHGRPTGGQAHPLMQQDLMPAPGLASGMPRSGQIKLHGPDAFQGM